MVQSSMALYIEGHSCSFLMLSGYYQNFITIEIDLMVSLVSFGIGYPIESKFYTQ